MVSRITSSVVPSTTLRGVLERGTSDAQLAVGSWAIVGPTSRRPRPHDGGLGTRASAKTGVPASWCAADCALCLPPSLACTHHAWLAAGAERAPWCWRRVSAAWPSDDRHLIVRSSVTEARLPGALPWLDCGTYSQNRPVRLRVAPSLARPLSPAHPTHCPLTPDPPRSPSPSQPPPEAQSVSALLALSSQNPTEIRSLTAQAATRASAFGHSSAKPQVHMPNLALPALSEMFFASRRRPRPLPLRFLASTMMR